MMQINPFVFSTTPPAKPPSASSMLWSTSGAYANLTSRQTSLEPSNAGVDTAYTWMFWVRPTNIGGMDGSMRIVSFGPITNANVWYNIGINPSSAQTANQVLSVLFQTSSGNSIGRYTSMRLLKGRVSFCVVTYDGSESNSGIKIYINGVEDTSTTGTSAGSYTGINNDSNGRIQFSSVNSTTSRFSGDLKDFCFFKGLAINQTQVTEAYNNGVPGTVTALSFYGSITAYYPFATDLTCTNNAALNIGNSSGVTTRTSNFGSLYESISFFNAYPPNTRYLGFGAIGKVDDEIRIYQNSGTSHLANKYIVKMVYDEANKIFSAPSTVLDQLPTNSLMSVGWLDVASKIIIGTTKYNSPTFLDLIRFESTNGRVGSTFGAETSMTANLSGYNFYSTGKRRGTTNEWWIAEPEAVAATDYRLYYWKTDGTTWTKVLVWSGAPGLSLGEPELIWITDLTGIILARSESNNGLYRLYTTDGGSTWSAAAATNLGNGRCNAAMCLDPYGNIQVVYMQRGATAGLYVSLGNSPAGVISSPTSFTTPSAVLYSYSTDSTNMLGYPGIVRKGWIYYISCSCEFSSSRADQYIGVGRLD